MDLKNEGAVQKDVKSTFVVHIRHRQNSSWQGDVTWVESKQSSSFRSALELIKLMDSALNTVEESENQM